MPQDNVETLRRGLEAFNSGDMERIVAFIDPEFEGEVPSELSAEPDTYRGHEGVRRYFRSFDDVMEEIHFTPVRVWDAGDRVAILLRLSARGRQTSIEVTQEVAQVWTFRDRRAVRARAFPSLAEALAAAGLSEQAAETPL
jgi:ketosteroid isomerase-like protein